MLNDADAATIPLPKYWSCHVRSAVLHTIALARYAAAQVRGWAAGCVDLRVHLQAELDRARQEIALLREELRIKDARMDQITSQGESWERPSSSGRRPRPR